MPTCGSLFSGAGLLDIGLHLAGFRHAWLCESDPYRRGLLRARFPGAVVYDDIRTLVAPPVDLIAGGFPCKGASSAGKQNGFEHAETVLWHEMRRVIGELQPRIVLIENVANILGMAAAPGEPAGSLWGTVLADLAALGFDAVWDCVPAAAVGAPHLRDRVFCVAAQSARANEQRDGGQQGRADGRTDAAGSSDRAAAHAEREPVELRRGARTMGAAPTGSGGAAWQQRAGSAAADRDQDAAADADGQRRGNGAGTAWSGIGSEGRRADASRVAVEWGEYAPAIGRWEAIHGASPEPLVRRVDDGDAKLSRVRARVDRSRLSALGDGVHVYCAWLVGQYVMGLFEDEAVAT